MASMIVSQPGSPHGPCPSPCDHPDCALCREMAERECVFCRSPLGYEQRITHWDIGEGIAHVACISARIAELKEQQIMDREAARLMRQTP